MGTRFSISAILYNNNLVAAAFKLPAIVSRLGSATYLVDKSCIASEVSAKVSIRVWR